MARDWAGIFKLDGTEVDSFGTKKKLKAWTCPGFFRSGAHVKRPFVQRPRGFSSPMLSVAAGVVEAVDVFEEGDFDVPPGMPVSAPDQFGLEGFEEALDGRVVITVSLPAHR